VSAAWATVAGLAIATAAIKAFGPVVFGGRELPALLARELDDYHAYAFATVRMAGSAFEVAGSHARWLYGPAADPTVEAMSEIVDGCKALSFRLARRREFDPEPLISSLAAAWARALEALSDVTG